MSPPASRRLDARMAAFRAVQAFSNRGAFVLPVIDELASSHRITAADRALAVEIACGVVRRQGTLHAVLAAYSSRPVDSLEAGLRTILQLGLYQLLFLDRVPAYAAVDETVQLCRRVGQPRAVRFVNGILRSVVRDLPQPVPLSGLDACSAATIPLVSRPAELPVRALCFPRALFADPQVRPAAYLAEALSLPQWLVDRWGRRITWDRVFQRGLWFSVPGPLSVRVNLLQVSRQTCLDVLRAAGVEARPGRFPESITAVSLPPVENLPGFHEGWFTVQDESAMAAVDLLAPQPGERILDRCAAPGTKTCFIAERQGNEGRIVASDIDPRRLAMVADNCRRLGISIVECRTAEWGPTDAEEQPFDAVMLDVPCSNTGVLGKRPEARWRITPQSMEELAATQRQLLHEVVGRVRPGGRIVYSTCSIEPEENEQVVQAVLAEHPQCRLVEERRHEPGEPCDGAYQALLQID